MWDDWNSNFSNNFSFLFHFIYHSIFFYSTCNYSFYSMYFFKNNQLHLYIFLLKFHEMLKNQIIDPSCYQTDPSKKIVLPPPLATSTLFKLSSFCLGYCTSVLICFDEYLLYTVMSHFTLNTVLDTTSIHSQIFQELKQSVKYVWSGLFILSKLNTIFKTNDLSTIIYNT